MSKYEKENVKVTSIHIYNSLYAFDNSKLQSFLTKLTKQFNLMGETQMRQELTFLKTQMYFIDRFKTACSKNEVAITEIRQMEHVSNILESMLSTRIRFINIILYKTEGNYGCINCKGKLVSNVLKTAQDPLTLKFLEAIFNRNFVWCSAQKVFRFIFI